MKRQLLLLLIILLVIGMLGCNMQSESSAIVATTLPVYEFSSALCAGTDLTVGLLVSENISCLHDYTLQVSQMRMIEAAEIIVISGAGLEAFLDDAIPASKQVVDASRNIHLIETDTHSSEHAHDHSHEHETDPHIWLSPENAMTMAENICLALTAQYPEHKLIFEENLRGLLKDLNELYAYGQAALSNLSGSKMITFHDGFSYFAECFDLDIVRTIEEESGSEASASELKELICLVEFCALSSLFVEENGSTSAAEIISAETGTSIYVLKTGLSGSSYFDAMYHNINTIKEALE